MLLYTRSHTLTYPLFIAIGLSHPFFLRPGSSSIPLHTLCPPLADFIYSPPPTAMGLLFRLEVLLYNRLAVDKNDRLSCSLDLLHVAEFKDFLAVASKVRVDPLGEADLLLSR